MTREERAAEAHARVVRSIATHVEDRCRVASLFAFSRRRRLAALDDAEAWWLRLTEAEREAHPETAATLNAAVRDMAGGE